MKKTRFLAALTAAAMTLSLAILPASAEETATEITIKGTQFSNTEFGDGMAINKYQDTRPMSVMFNVAEEGYYKFQFRASDGSHAWLSSYDVNLNGIGKFEKKTKDGTDNVVVFDYGTVYLNKGFNELTYTLTGLRDTGTGKKDYLIYLDYAKFTKLSDDYRYTSSKNGVSDFGLISSGSDDIGYENENGKKISGKIYAPKNGTYAINYIGSIYDGQYTAPYSIYLDNEKLSNAKAGAWYNELKQMKNFSTSAYMDAGEHEFSFVLEGDKLFYLKNMTVSDYSIALEGGVEGTAFNGVAVNSGAKFDFYQKKTTGSVTATVSADVAGWYKMKYEATPGDGSNAYVSEYSIKLNDTEIAVPAPGKTTDNSMAVHSVDNNVWLNKGNNELIFNINTLGSGRDDGLYVFYIRSASFELVNETVEHNKELSVPYTEFSGDGVHMDTIDDYPIAYVSDNRTPKVMTAAFNAEEAGVYSLKLIATSGASGEKTKKDWHSNYNVFVNGVLINNFARYANVLKPSGAVAEQLEGHRAENVYLKAGANTIKIIPTEKSSNNVYLVYLNSASFAKSQASKSSAIYLAEKTDNGVKVAYINVKETGKLIAASYDESGKLKDVKIADALHSMTETTETLLPLAAAEGDKVKVMLWGDIENQAPSAEAFSIR